MSANEYLWAKIKDLPSTSGIYLYKDVDANIIYVGKSVNLKSRVSSYFNSSPKSHKITALVKNIVDFDTIHTTDEVQALLLEQDLIKKYLPKYNTLLRDDKSYPYVHITAHQYPQIKLVHLPTLEVKENHYGPYVSGFEIGFLLDAIESLLGIRTCSDAYMKTRTRPCIKYNIGKCCGVCIEKIENYDELVSAARKILDNKTKQMQSELKEKMISSSEQQEYEKAKQYRDILFNLQKIMRPSEYKKAVNTDVWGYYASGDKAVVSWFAVRGGRLHDKKFFFTENTPSFYEDIINQYYFSQNYKIAFNLQEVFVESIENASVFEDAFFERTSKKIKIVSIGEKLNHFFDSAMKTAKEELLARENRFLLKEQRGLIDLADRLSLPHIERLGCFDISNQQDKWRVAAYTHYDVNDEKKLVKSRYRLYHIQTEAEGDVNSMNEAVRRHFASKIDEATGEMIHNDIPDLLVIDGGKPQISATLEALYDSDIDNLAIIGIAKGVTRKEINERYFFTIFSRDEMPKISEITDMIRKIDLTAMRKVRDEAHRFSKKNLSKNRDELRIKAADKALKVKKKSSAVPETG